MQKITLLQPDDWHIHLRDGAYLAATVTDVARYFGRAIVMPNLTPPVTTVSQALRYREEILAHRPSGSTFEPLMTLYLTEQTSIDEIKAAADAPEIVGCKLYPAGATTNSDAGVTSITRLYPIFEAMETHQLPLLVHGEVTDPRTDIFDREHLFIDECLGPLVRAFPALKVIFEHITTLEAVQFVRDSGPAVAATITAHHLLYDRTAMFQGGLKPILYCLPVLKRDHHRAALLDAATSGNPKFFLGTDSAPHPRHHKENACGCAAGCYTAASAIELYAEAFDQADRLEALEGFSSHFGPDFYGLVRNTKTITLEAKPWTLPQTIPFGEDQLMPLRGGERVNWRVQTESADHV